MNLMFWKKKTVAESDAAPDEARGKAVAEESPARKARNSEADAPEDGAHIKAARFKKRLSIFGAFGLLVLIPLVLGVAAWKVFFSSSHKEAAPDTVTDQRVILPSPHSDKKFIKLPGIEFSQMTPQQADAARAARAELKALKKQEELEEQFKAIEQGDPESASIVQEELDPAPVAQEEPATVAEPHPEPASIAQKKSEPAPIAQKPMEPARAIQKKPVQWSVTSAGGGSGEAVLGSEDPKTTASTLKAAIEAMNASTGGYPKKPAAKQPVKKQAH